MSGRTKNSAILLLGSNINPEENIFHALDLLGTIREKSRVWKTAAYGTNGPDFLNMAVKIETSLNHEDLKNSVITCIEKSLHRIRTEDKYAPRTIDIDIIVFNGEVVDKDVWDKPFVAIPISEIAPSLKNEQLNQDLSQIVEKMKSSALAELYGPINLK